MYMSLEELKEAIEASTTTQQLQVCLLKLVERMLWNEEAEYERRCGDDL